MANLNVITVNEVLVVDSRLIADELDIQHESFIRTIRKYLTEIQEFGHIRFENDFITNSVGARNTIVFCYLNEKQAQSVISKSRNGLKPESIEKFKKMGFDFSMFPYINRQRNKAKEADYSNALAKELGGRREVQTLAGSIDVLTSLQVIEVKEVKAWKQALGQVLVYGHYYPSHQKRIHLYGETQESFLRMVHSHCKRFDVVVTWEQ